MRASKFSFQGPEHNLIYQIFTSPGSGIQKPDTISYQLELHLKVLQHCHDPIPSVMKFLVMQCLVPHRLH